MMFLSNDFTSLDQLMTYNETNMSLHLQILTPRRIIFEKDISLVTVPGTDGELTVLAQHAPLVTSLEEGVVRIVADGGENLYSIGGGYLETDGQHVKILVSRAYGQHDIDEREVLRAQEEAERVLASDVSEHEREGALRDLRHALFDQKLIEKTKHRKH